MHVFILLAVIGAFPFILVAGDCPNRWRQFRNNCYLLVKRAYTWFEARRHCEQIDAHLVIIRDQEEQQFIKGFKSTYKKHWIGLHDLKQENTWQWVDGSESFGYSNWNDGEPNNSGNNEHCVYTDLNKPMLGKWNDIRCSTRLAHLCQRHL